MLIGPNFLNTYTQRSKFPKHVSVILLSIDENSQLLTFDTIVKRINKNLPLF